MKVISRPTPAITEADGQAKMKISPLAGKPTPVVSHAILTYNHGRKTSLADGIVITPSHNPPEDGGFKYDPPSGGPADSATTKWIQDRANALIASGLKDVKRIPFARARSAATTHRHDFMHAYIDDLGAVIDLDRKSTRLNSSHVSISYAVFCLKKKKKN